MTPRSRADFVLSPLFLLSLVVLLVNDFILKPHSPSWFSGIASDVAGMVFFPVFLVALAELACVLLPGRPWASPGWFIGATVTVAVLFVLVKFTDWGSSAYVRVVNPIEGALGSLLNLPQVGVVRDPWDLLALPFGAVAVWIGYRWRGGAGTSTGAPHPSG